MVGMVGAAQKDAPCGCDYEPTFQKVGVLTARSGFLSNGGFPY